MPIYIAAITPKSILQTGEIADGIFPIHCPKSRFETLRASLNDGAARAGRTGADLTIAPFTNVYVLGEGNDEEVWRAARQPLFHYINRMGDFYWKMLADNGFEDDVVASRAAWRGDRDQAAAMAAISEEMVREIQVIGPMESVAEQLSERANLGADLQMINMPAGTPSEAGQRLEQLVASMA